MRVITSHGEQGLSLPDGREAKLRPSLYAMTQLGTPEEIVAKFATLHSQPRLMTFDESDAPGVIAAGMMINKQRVRDHWREVLFLSWEILTACSDDDLTPFIGGPGSRYASYRIGPVSPEIMRALACSLMQYGVIGPLPKQVPNEEPKAPDPSKYTPAFDASLYVSKAVAHLGFSEDDAWNLTLTGFAKYWEAKYGEDKTPRHSAEHDATMSWLAKVNAVRDKKKQ